MKKLSLFLGTILLSGFLFLVFLALRLWIQQFIETGPEWSESGLRILGTLIILAGFIVLTIRRSNGAWSGSVSLIVVGSAINHATNFPGNNTLSVAVVAFFGVCLAAMIIDAQTKSPKDKAPSEEPV